MDNLSNMIYWITLILIIINLFLDNIYLTIISLVLVLINIYRMFSKKINKRRKENQIYLKIVNKIKTPFKTFYENMKDKNYVYKKCHHCHKKLRLPIPSERGIKHVKCPKCRKRNTFIILKKIKIEVIKK